MSPFLQFQGSGPGLFNDLSAGDFCPSALPTDAGPAVSPTNKLRKDSCLPSVTSEKAHYLLSRVKIWAQEKARNTNFSKS